MCKTNALWIGLLALSLHGENRPGQIMSGNAVLNNGAVIRFTTVAEPPLGSRKGMPGGLSIRNDRVQRYMVDTTEHKYFGYDLVIDPAGAGSSRYARIEPLSLSPHELRGIGGVTPAPLLLPKYPPPQMVQNGDTIALDLLVSADGRQKIVDYIEIESGSEPPAPNEAAEPRDFTFDDGPLSFSFRPPANLWTNGRTAGSVAMTGKPGGTLWFAIPGRGRFILSLTPHDGFRKAGAIRGTAIVFQDGGERYELRTSGPILPSGGAWNLYVLHDPLFNAGRAPQYGTDRLQNLLPKR